MDETAGRRTQRMPAWSRSLRWRLQIWHAAFLGLLIVGFVVVVWFLEQRTLMRETDEQLLAAVRELKSQLDVSMEGTSNGSLETGISRLKLPDVFGRRRFRRPEDEPWLIVQDFAGRPIRAEGSPPEQPLRRGSREVLRDGVRFISLGPHRGAVLLLSSVTILVGRDLSPEQDRIRRLMAMLSVIGAVVFFIGLAGGWVLAGRAIGPIEEVSRVAEVVSASELSRRISLPNADREFSGLIETLNQMLERLERAFRQQQDFTADASHELRTPLAVIRTHLELALSRERSGDEYRATLLTCQKAAERMSELSDSLLALSRLDAGKGHVVMMPHDLTAAVRRCADEIHPVAEEAGVTIRVEGTAGAIEAAPDLIHRLLTNLLRNAVNYSDRGGIVMVVVETVRNGVELRVTDTGCGIPQEAIPHLFDRFYRVNSDRKRTAGGSGLGLAICRSIVSLHRGTITIVSSAGQGTTVEVWFPASAADNRESSTAAEGSYDAANSTGGEIGPDY